MKTSKFSLLLRQLRKNSGLTQKQVADALNVERSTYAYYETGITHPSCPFIIKLAKIFNVNYSVFIDVIADTALDENEDNSYFTNLADEYSEKSNKIYEITSSEQELILLYRLMTSEEKEKILENIRVKRL